MLLLPPPLLCKDRCYAHTHSNTHMAVLLHVWSSSPTSLLLALRRLVVSATRATCTTTLLLATLLGWALVVIILFILVSLIVVILVVVPVACAYAKYLRPEFESLQRLHHNNVLPQAHHGAHH